MAEREKPRETKNPLPTLEQVISEKKVTNGVISEFFGILMRFNDFKENIRNSNPHFLSNDPPNLEGYVTINDPLNSDKYSVTYKAYGKDQRYLCIMKNKKQSRGEITINEALQLSTYNSGGEPRYHVEYQSIETHEKTATTEINTVGAFEHADEVLQRFVSIAKDYDTATHR